MYANVLFVFEQHTLQSRGYIYRGKYEGWYCVSDEAFLSDDQVTEVTGDRGSKLRVSFSTNRLFRYLASIKFALLTLSLPMPLRLYTLPYWSNPPFLISDVWALWRSGMSARAPKCQKLKIVGQTSMAPNTSNSSNQEKLALKGLNYLPRVIIKCSWRYFCCTVILRYNGLAYNVSLVIAYASSRSRHISMLKVSVITYLDITYPRLLRTNFGAKTLQWTPSSTYIRPPSSQLTSVNNVPAVGATL